MASVVKRRLTEPRRGLCGSFRTAGSLAFLGFLTIPPALAAPATNELPACVTVDSRSLRDLERLAWYDQDTALGGLECRRHRFAPGSHDWVDTALVEALLLFNWHGKFSDARSLGAELATAALDDRRLHAITDLLHAQSAILIRDWSSADMWLMRARLTLDDEADAWIQMRLLRARMNTKIATGDIASAEHIEGQLIALADATGDTACRAFERSWAARYLAMADRIVHARRRVQEARAITRDSNDWLLIADIDSTISFVNSLAKDDAGLRSDLEAAVAHARRGTQPSFKLAVATADLTDFYLKHGENELGIASAKEALQIAQAIRNQTSIEVARSNLLLAEIFAGHKAVYERAMPAQLEQDRAEGPLNLEASLGEFADAMRKAGDDNGALALLHQQRQVIVDNARQRTREIASDTRVKLEAENRRLEIDLVSKDSAIKQDALDYERTRRAMEAVWIASTALIVAAMVHLGLRLRRANAKLAAGNLLLADQSQTDALTGLANRRRFQSLMEAGDFDRRFNGGLILLDIDHFKRINDTFGHGAGDQVLIEVARRIQAVLRPDDVAIRWGGEEVLVFFPGATSEDLSVASARVMESVARCPINIGSDAIPVTASLGYVAFPMPECKCEVPWKFAVTLADAAMFLAKNGGRHRIMGLRRLRATNDFDLERLRDSLQDGVGRGDVEVVEIVGAEMREPE